MTWSVLWEPSALNSATGYLKSDPAGVDVLLRAVDSLGDDPRVAGSHPWGSDHRRLRQGRPWRVLYRIDSVGQTLHIEHVGRIAG